MEKESLENLLGSVKSKVDFVSAADNALDGKAGTLMGFEIAIVLGYLSIAFKGLEGYDPWIGVAGLIFISVSIAMLFYVNWPKKYTTISVNIFEYNEYLSKEENDLLLQLISDTQNAFTKNNEVLKQKVKWYKKANIFLIISTILFVISII